VTCDRCAAVLVEDRVLLPFRVGPMRLPRPALDLCQACVQALAEWLRQAQEDARPSADRAVTL
jgi:hypothetical protein